MPPSLRFPLTRTFQTLPSSQINASFTIRLLFCSPLRSASPAADLGRSDELGHTHLCRDEVNAISTTVSKPEQASASGAGSECDYKSVGSPGNFARKSPAPRASSDARESVGVLRCSLCSTSLLLGCRGDVPYGTDSTLFVFSSPRANFCRERREGGGIEHDIARSISP
jgi:hypothetical protein